MHNVSLHKISLLFLLVVSLSACVTEDRDIAATQAASTGLVTQGRSIDWDRADQDAALSGEQNQKREASSSLAVPLLLPPSQVDVSDTVGLIVFEQPKILTDAKGYSAVIGSKHFDMLIDASNQMIRTSDAATAEFPQDFDGKYQAIEMGSQLTIGRYGALYAIQFICTAGDGADCINEQTVQEIVQSLQVQQP